MKMSDYNLAPKSIVDELAQFIRKVDGNNRMGAGALADKICERFHVAAPAMQGEPVAYLFNDEAGRTKIVLGKETAELWCPPDESITPLYTAPQPAEQPCPEDIREGAPYDDPAFESLCREHEVWGTAAAALCSVFWEAGKRGAEQQPAPHPDDAAVDRFAAAMKAKLAKKRSEGRTVWQEANSVYLSELLREHVEKGDPVDVGNLAMMIHENGFSIEKKPVRWATVSGCAEQNPDVSALVDALEDVVFYHEEVEDNDGNLMMHYSKMMRK